MNKLFEKNRPVIVDGILYTLTALIVVISAWAEDLHRFDLDLTISRYVGLRHWTANLYMVIAVLMVSMIFVYLRKSGMHIVRKVLYGAAFLCILGCAFFPHNVEWSTFASNVHNYFAYGLMLIVTVSIVMMIFTARNKSQRVFGIVAAAYATYFIIAYVIVGWKFFGNTIFLWENTFIYLLLGELMVEYEDSRVVEIFSKRFPFVALVGIAFAWLMYLMAPREGLSIDDTHGIVYNSMIAMAVIILLISCIVFCLSFIMYMLYRPLAEKRIWLDVILRIIITPVIIFVMVIGTGVSLFLVSGAGF